LPLELPSFYENKLERMIAIATETLSEQQMPFHDKNEIRQVIVGMNRLEYHNAHSIITILQQRGYNVKKYDMMLYELYPKWLNYYHGLTSNIPTRDVEKTT